MNSEKMGKSGESVLARYVPVLQWLPNYTRMQAFEDFIAGLTVGLTMVPQSLAYAALAGLSPQYGLYSSFLGGFLYLIFGTVKEVSIGPSSLMALLTINYTRDMNPDFVILLTFLSGCVELFMGLLNVGFLVDFISFPVTSGFTSATSVIIIIAQLQGLFGLRLKSKNILDNIIKLFQNYKNIRINDTMLGCASMIFLLSFRQLQHIDCSFLNAGRTDQKRGNMAKKILWVLSISRNALVVMMCLLLSWHLSETGRTPFILSGQVKSGLPNVSLPPFSSQFGNKTYDFFEMCSHLESGILVVPLIAVLANIAIAKAFGVKASQEMRTLGICNILGSLVSSMPTAGAFTRSAVSSASGIQTPMAGLYSGTLALLALSFLTPYFYYIPRATLAAILICAVFFLIDWRIVPILLKGSKVDAVALILTFILCLLMSVEIGLLVGVIINLFYLLYHSARPKMEVSQCKTSSGEEYILVTPDTGLFYPAVDFANLKIVKISDKYKAPLIVDCQKFKGIDYTTIMGIERLLAKFEDNGKKISFLNVNQSMRRQMEKLGLKKSLVDSLIDSVENINQHSEKKSNLLEANQGAATVPLLIEMKEKPEHQKSTTDESKLNESSKAFSKNSDDNATS